MMLIVLRLVGMFAACFEMLVHWFMVARPCAGMFSFM